jgi:hypothetical protein
MTISSDCIPEFAPGRPDQSAAKWVDKLDQLAQVNQWDDNTIVQLMQQRLTGLARAWYDNLTTYTYSWAEWKALLVKNFPDHRDFAATLRQAVERIKLPNETMTQYYFSKMNLLRACNISGKDAVSCLIEGLTDRTLQNGAKAWRFESPEQLYAEYLSTLTTDAQYSLEMKRNPQWGYEDCRRRYRSRPTNNKLRRPMKRASLRCFNCNGSGHPFSQCKRPKIECNRCKRLGHDEDHCRAYKENQDSWVVQERNPQVIPKEENQYSWVLEESRSPEVIMKEENQYSWVLEESRSPEVIRKEENQDSWVVQQRNRQVIPKEENQDS